MANISIDQLAAEIAKELSQYSQEVVEKINVSSERVGKAAVQKLKQTSPKRTGAYAKSWTPHHRLAHLLEYGHAKKGGGRVEGKPHIAPVEEEVIREFTSEVEEAIKRG